MIYDINDRGQMVGIYIDAGATPGPNGYYPPGIQHAFMWDKGVVTVVDPPDTVSAPNAYGIINKGQIVGVYLDADLKQHGYLLDHGTYTPTEPPGSAENKAFGINDHGQVVGIYLDDGALPGPTASTRRARSTATCGTRRTATPRSTCPGHEAPSRRRSTTAVRSSANTRTPMAPFAAS